VYILGRTALILLRTYLPAQKVRSTHSGWTKNGNFTQYKNTSILLAAMKEH